MAMAICGLIVDVNATAVAVGFGWWMSVSSKIEHVIESFNHQRII